MPTRLVTHQKISTFWPTTTSTLTACPPGDDSTTQLHSKVDGESLNTTTVPPSTENKLEKKFNETQELNVTTVTTDQNSALNSKESVDKITTDLVEANTEKMDEEESMKEAKNR